MFKDNFERLLQTHNVKAYAVAKATGISQGLLSEYKSGKKEPSIPNLQKLADYFDVTVDDLLGEENVKAAAPEGSGQYEEFARIFKELTPENQNKIIAEMLRRAREQ